MVWIFLSVVLILAVVCPPFRALVLLAALGTLGCFVYDLSVYPLSR